MTSDNYSLKFKRFSKKEYTQIPNEPGVYKYISQSDKIIYVGKAKSLRKRVSSYFNNPNSQTNRKTLKLINEIVSIEIVVVNSEEDALLLENNLIKYNQPKYNILLKDDKTYPSIVITQEEYPRILLTRKIKDKKNEYIGPFSDVKSIKNMLNYLIKSNKIRTCSLALTDKKIKARKFKVCLEYHIGNCYGPCEHFQKKEDYLERINLSTQIIKGHIKGVIKKYKSKMLLSAKMLAFEKASDYKNQIIQLEKLNRKTSIISKKINDLDIFFLRCIGTNTFFINYIQILNGTMINSETVEVKERVESNIENILKYAIYYIRDKYNSATNTIICNYAITLNNQLKSIVPKSGIKKKLIELSNKNIEVYIQNVTKKNLVSHKDDDLSSLKENLKLPKIPYIIECFDNSNLQGSHPVASVIQFKNGVPNKKEYRKFKIKTIEGIDDYGSMEEIVYRRYKRLINEKRNLPDLILIDGGKGQLKSACKALSELDIYGRIPIVSIAKRIEEIYFPNDSDSLILDRDSNALKLLQRVRDEAHRFAVTFHKNLRNKENKSELLKIEGIGEKTYKKIIRHFKSIYFLNDKNEENLSQLVGKHKARLILNKLAEIKKG